MPMHVGALHVFELPAGYKGRFVRDLRAHMAKRLPIVPALRRKAVVDAAQPGRAGLGRCRARPNAAHRRDQAAQGGAFRRRPAQLEAQVARTASDAARPQLPAVEVPCLRGSGAGLARPQARGDVQPAAPRRGRRPGRSGAGQRHPRRHAAAACDRVEAEPAREAASSSSMGEIAARCDGAPDHAGDPDREATCPARWARSAAPRRDALQGGAAQQRAVRRQGRLAATSRWRRRRRSTPRSPTDARSPPCRCRWPSSRPSARRTRRPSTTW